MKFKEICIFVTLKKKNSIVPYAFTTDLIITVYLHFTDL